MPLTEMSFLFPFERAHFASVAMMNFTVESSADPHVLSWAIVGLVKHPTKAIAAKQSIGCDIRFLT